MPRWDSFGRSLLFAAAAAAALPVAVAFGSPLLGGLAVVRLYAIAAAVVYTAGLASSRPARIGTLALAGLAGIAIALGSRGLPATAWGAAAIVACGRGVLVGAGRPLRAALLETALGLAGLAVANFLAAGGGLVSICLALWGYFLVQSSFFLFGSHAATDALVADPFERARLRLERLLEEEGGRTR